MAEGYQCDKCGTFSEHTHKMTTIDIGGAASEDGRLLKPKYVLCPECATDLREDIQGVNVPEEARESAL